VITFTSSSTALNFNELMRGLGKDRMRNVAMASVGPVTSSTLRGCGYRVDIEARTYTMPGLAEAIVKATRNRKLKGLNAAKAV
jgi:uroporphyrinogen III methyltransferase/synthase